MPRRPDSLVPGSLVPGSLVLVLALCTAGIGTAAEVTAEESSPERFEFLPGEEIFDPLLADPRQPHFSLSTVWYSGDPELRQVGMANLGETFALFGGCTDLDCDARWELGLLGGVFSIFDLDAASLDLVNTDFLVGPTFSLRRGALSSQLRIYHQSSHLGDEFLLRNRTERVNLSYEGVDLLLSAAPHRALRIYLGGGAIVHDEPDLDTWSGQAGVELQSPIAWLGVVRPLAAVDFQVRQEHGWDDEIAADRRGLR